MLVFILTALLIRSNTDLTTFHKTRFFDSKVVRQIEDMVQTECGQQCFAMYHEMLQWVWNNQDTIAEGEALNEDQLLEKQLTSLLNRELGKVQHMYDTFEQHRAVSFLQIEQHSRTLIQAPLADVPCDSQTACNAMERIGNACNYMRLGANFIYSAVNNVVFVVGAIMNLLCGCIHISKLSYCLLGFVPYICNFPNSVYGKIYSISGSLWEAVKGSTKKCQMHGHPMLLLR